MARRTETIVTSDLSGEAVVEGKAASMIVSFDDGRRSQFVLDLTAAEAEDFAKKGREQKRRGRRPGSTNVKSKNGRRKG